MTWGLHPGPAGHTMAIMLRLAIDFVSEVSRIPNAGTSHWHCSPRPLPSSLDGTFSSPLSLFLVLLHSSLGLLHASGNLKILYLLCKAI